MLGVYLDWIALTAVSCHETARTGSQQPHDTGALAFDSAEGMGSAGMLAQSCACCCQQVARMGQGALRSCGEVELQKLMGFVLCVPVHPGPQKHTWLMAPCLL